MKHDKDTAVNTDDTSTPLTRRSLFQRASFLIAAAALPPVRGWSAPNASPAPEEVSPMMERLSAYMSAARDRALPDEVVEKAKRHTLDTLAAMVSGSGLAPGQAALNMQVKPAARK